MLLILYACSRFFFRHLYVAVLFLLLGIAGAVASLCAENTFISALLGVFAFSSFWGIKEIFEQEERVRKGWFPKNPKRTYKF